MSNWQEERNQNAEDYDRLAAEVQRLRLTVSERHALKSVIRALNSTDYEFEYVTLQKMLERLTGTGDMPQPHPTPPQGPVAWAVAGDNGNYAVKLCFDELGAQREVYRRTSMGLKQDYVVVPLYCHPKLTITDAELNAIQHVVEDGRLVDISDYGRLRSLLVRLRPEWEGVDD